LSHGTNEFSGGEIRLNGGVGRGDKRYRVLQLADEDVHGHNLRDQ
jgi:hypothetical protein